MGQVLHKRAATTHEVRAAIRRSSASIKEPAARYGINPRTVQKRRKRESVEDAPMGARRPAAVLTERDEAIIRAFRMKTRLSLDDCFLALTDEIPKLTRGNLRRCPRRHGPSRRPRPETPAKKRFRRCEIGVFHVDVCEVPTGEGRLRLFVGVDRTCKYVCAELHEAATASAAARFMRNPALAVPCRLHRVLTDNGVQFTYRLLAKPPRGRVHPFDAVCADLKVEHRLTQIGRPWTNGQVERMNRTLKQATVASYRYDTHAQLKRHLHSFLDACNHARKLKALKWKAPVEKILDTFDAKPDIFHSDPRHYSMGLSILGLDRLRLRGPNGARDEFHLAAMARNLRKLAKLVPEPA